MGKLALAVLLAVIAVHLSEGVGPIPSHGNTPVRINPYVMKYLQVRVFHIDYGATYIYVMC